MTSSERTSNEAFAAQLRAFAEGFDHVLATVLPTAKQSVLADDMSYAVCGPAKRFRAIQVQTAFRLLHADMEAARSVGCAVELMHAASLVLDDMPSMDAAATRRQKPALHHHCGEGRALMTAMSLVMLAFELLGTYPTALSGDQRCLLVSRLAACCGAAGIAAGQAVDLAGDGLNSWQKTAPLLGFCWESAAIVTGAPAEQRAKLYAFGERLGRLFQMRDDELDGSSLPSDDLSTLHRHIVDDLANTPPVNGMTAQEQRELRDLVDWVAEREQ